MGTVVYPAPQFRTLLAQFILYVDFFFLIARPGKIDAAQYALFDVTLPFHLVQEIFGKVWVAKKQPVFAFGSVSRTLLHKCTERRNPRAWSNNNHRCLRVSRQAEVIVVFDEHAHFALFFHAIREEAGGATSTGTTFNVITHHAHGDVHFAVHFRLGRGNRIQTRRQRAQKINQRLGVQLRWGEAHHIDDWRGCGVMLQLRFVAHQRQQRVATG